MWDQLGSPTANAESGTQEEFEEAYRLWKANNGFPEIMFYFRSIKEAPRNASETEQLLKVYKFRDALSDKVKYKTYKNPDEFAVILREDLEMTARRLIQKLKEFPATGNRIAKTSEHVKSVDIEEIEKQWKSKNLKSSFIPNSDNNKGRFYRVRIPTTAGYVKDSDGKEKARQNFVSLLKDPIRPFDIQIGETRSMRQMGNPTAIPDLTNLDLGSVRSMYPFLQVDGYKWIRMVLAELTADKKVLDYIYQNDNDPQVKSIAARNPSASSELQERECLFCQDGFWVKRDKQSGSDKTIIIANDYPYGPYFHYIAYPSRAVHAWQDLEFRDIFDLNLTIWKFLNRNHREKKWMPSPAEVFIGLNSSIRHLVMGTHTRTSAGASITHV